MTIEMGFNKEQPEEAREKRILKIMGDFSKLSPEMQEAVIEFAESLNKEEKSDGQNPPT